MSVYASKGKAAKKKGKKRRNGETEVLKVLKFKKGIIKLLLFYFIF